MKTTKRPVIFNEDNRFPLVGYSRVKAVEQSGAACRTTIVGDLHNWTAVHAEYRIAVRKNSIYWKETSNISCTLKEGKLYGNLSPSIKEALVRLYNLDWISTNSWVCNILAERRSLWTQIFTGKITNPKDLCTHFSKRYLQGKFSYRSLKAYAQSQIGVSLWDLLDYTTNPDKALELALQPYTEGWLWRDLLYTSKTLGVQFNPLWSYRRMQEEHLKQARQISLLKADSISDKQISSPFEKDGLSLILNERECFIEGECMHNCIHSCYWNRVKQGKYILAKGTINGEYVHLGIDVAGENPLIIPRIDQVHTIRNGKVSSETKNQCTRWIFDNELGLIDKVKDILTNQ